LAGAPAATFCKYLIFFNHLTRCVPCKYRQKYRHFSRFTAPEVNQFPLIAPNCRSSLPLSSRGGDEAQSVGLPRDVVRAIVWIGRQPAHFVNDLLQGQFSGRGIDCDRWSPISAVQQVVSRCKPKRCWLFRIPKNRHDYLQRFVLILARRLVKRHPLSRRRKQRQRSASLRTASTRTFSASRHDSKLI
jgi:hypothetical protein